MATKGKFPLLIFGNANRFEHKMLFLICANWSSYCSIKFAIVLYDCLTYPDGRTGRTNRSFSVDLQVDLGQDWISPEEQQTKQLRTKE